jgi:predicted nucleic acid-binding protein
MPSRFDRRRATVVAFDGVGWEPPDAVVLDTNVIAEMLLPDEPEHLSCDAVMRRFAAEGTTVIFSGLLVLELWEIVFNQALRHIPRRERRHRRFDRDSRQDAKAALTRAERYWNELLGTLDWRCVEVHDVADAVPDLMRNYGLQSYDAVHAATLLASGVTDLVSRDAGFAVLLPEDATLHTTRRRLGRTRHGVAMPAATDHVAERRGSLSRPAPLAALSGRPDRGRRATPESSHACSPARVVCRRPATARRRRCR